MHAMSRTEASMSTRSIISILVLAAICTSAFAPAHADEKVAVEQAKSAADAWLKLVDDGKYRASWAQAATLLKDKVTAERWEQMVTAARKPFGAVLSRKFAHA